jgi:eukaryotic-like serine/threonine-protein kinase
MNTALSPPVGQLLGGRYHVDSRIARGGMATVYLGTDTRLDRVIALKIAHPELSDDAEFVRRFIGEARSAARLSSPNVVAIFDQGSDKRLHYIAMEYVPGRTLRQLLNERGRLEPREALDIMAGVLSGLAAAHDAGFAHRDVKPENVLLTTTGTVKVADFGLARSVAGAVQTKGGMIIGTAAYLAPEQVSGGMSDARTDVYAAGIMLFELLTGMQPHTGASPLDVAYKHVNEVVPPPSSVLPGVPGPVDALVAMATSRDPDLRPANAGQFLRAIQEVKDGHAAPGPAPYQVPAYHAPAGEAPVGYERSAHPAPGPAAFSGPHGPGFGSGPQPGLPAYPGSGPQPGLPQPRGSGPLWAPPGDSSLHPYPVPHDDSGPRHELPARSGRYDHDPEMAQDTLLPGRGLQSDGLDDQHWDSGPQHASGAHRRDSGQFRDSGPHGEPGGWDTGPAVGASSLPSLSPQGSHLLPAPAAESTAQLNHTLIVSDASDLHAYGDLAPANQAPPYSGGRYPGRRPAGQRGRALFSARLMYVAGGLAVILVIALVAWWFSSGRYQKVPSLVGLTVTQAKNVLQNQGLHGKLGHSRHNPMVKGHIIKVDPGKGQKVPSGSTVTLTVSLGPVLRVVPNVSGQPEAAARAYLRQHHLRLGDDKPEVSSSVPAGTVIATIPRAYSKIPQTQPVRLIVSEGPGLPNFVGMQVSDAQAAAAAGGYTINAVANAKGSEPANTIVSQAPRPNSPITPGEVVTVHYSPGPPTIPVPDVRGMPVSQAILIMHQAGFRIAISHSGPGGTVGDYQPQGDQPKGTVITLTIGVFSGL